MTGVLAGSLLVPAQAASIPHSTENIETVKMPKSALLFRLDFDELPCLQELTQISNN
jgi:hypothetical protein